MASQMCSGIHPSMFLAADWASVVCLVFEHVSRRFFGHVVSSCVFLKQLLEASWSQKFRVHDSAWWCSGNGLANMLGDDHCFLCFAATWQNTSWITQRGLIKKEVHATEGIVRVEVGQSLSHQDAILCYFGTWGLHCNFWCWSSSSCCCGTLFFYVSLSYWNWGVGWLVRDW